MKYFTENSDNMKKYFTNNFINKNNMNKYF